MQHKNKILELSKKGYSYSQICEELNCSRGTVSYHLGIGQKEKTRSRSNKSKSRHPFVYKLYNFTTDKRTQQIKLIPKTEKLKLIYTKLHDFNKEYINKGYICMKTNITVEEVINKIGENPRCYLTGDIIDISKPNTYQFDHIMPRSRGGDNSLENLGLCTKLANLAKSNQTHDEFLNFCKKVLVYNGYKVN